MCCDSSLAWSERKAWSVGRGSLVVRSSPVPQPPTHRHRAAREPGRAAARSRAREIPSRAARPAHGQVIERASGTPSPPPPTPTTATLLRHAEQKDQANPTARRLFAWSVRTVDSKAASKLQTLNSKAAAYCPRVPSRAFVPLLGALLPPPPAVWLRWPLEVLSTSLSRSLRWLLRRGGGWIKSIRLWSASSS